MNEKFSVSICVYGKDNAKWFEQSIESILNQTVKPSEIVLVVDGPVSDDINQVISKYQFMDIFNVIRLEQNQGHGNARRIGLENCKNDLVALMDADDVCVSNRFEKQLEIIANKKDLSIVGGKIAEFIDDENNIVGYREVPVNQKDIYEYIKKRCPFNQMTVMFRKSDVKKAGGYLDWYCNEDYYLWIRMFLQNMKMANLSDVLVKVRVGEDMYRRRGGWKYFSSERKLQKFMHTKKIIGYGTYIINVTKRFILQVAMPNKLRGFIFKKFARTQG